MGHVGTVKYLNLGLVHIFWIMNCLAAGSDPPGAVDVAAIFLNFGWIVSDVRRSVSNC